MLPTLWNTRFLLRFIAFAAFAVLMPQAAHACETAADCDDGNACTIDSCVALACQYSNRPSSFPCDDGNVCTVNDHCSGAGTCVGGGNASTATACNDGNLCTFNDLCNGAGSCSGTAIDCSDGQFCNGLELCEPSSGCVSGDPPPIDDGNFCTIDYCDELIDSVLHEPVLPGTVCDDSDICTENDACDALGVCTGSPSAACSPDVPAASPTGRVLLVFLMTSVGAMVVTNWRRFGIRRA